MKKVIKIISGIGFVALSFISIDSVEAKKEAPGSGGELLFKVEKIVCTSYGEVTGYANSCGTGSSNCVAHSCS